MGQTWTEPVYRGEIQQMILGCDMKTFDLNSQYHFAITVRKDLLDFSPSPYQQNRYTHVIVVICNSANVGFP